MFSIDDVVLEWTARVPTGVIQFTDLDFSILEMILIERGLPLTFTLEYVSNVKRVVEKTSKDKSDAAIEAEKKGYIAHKSGWGNYADPSDPETVVAKTVDGKLVPVRGAPEPPNPDSEPEQEPGTATSRQGYDPSVEDRAAAGDVAAGQKVDRDEKEKKEGSDGESTPTFESIQQSKVELEDMQVALGYGGSAVEAKKKGVGPPPGNSTSFFNEFGSGMVTELQQSNPEWTATQLALALIDRIEPGGMYEEARKSSVSSGVSKAEMERMFGDAWAPDKKEQDKLAGLYSKVLLAVQNGMRKNKRINDHINALGWDPNNVKVIAFGGDSKSLENQSKLVNTAKTIVHIDHDGNKVEINPDKLVKLIQNSGGGENPSDTATFAINEATGELTVQFSSDKTSLNDIIANGTLVGELTSDAANRQLQELVDDPSNNFTQEMKDVVWEDRQELARQISAVEDKLKDVVAGPARSYLAHIKDPSAMKNAIDALKNIPGGNNPARYWESEVVTKFGNPFKAGGTSMKAAQDRALLYLPARPQAASYSDEPPTEEEMMTAFFVANSQEIPDDRTTGAWPTNSSVKAFDRVNEKLKLVDTDEIASDLEDIRKETLQLELSTVSGLDKKYSITVDGESVGIGTFIEANSIWDRGHFGMMFPGNGVFEYSEMFEMNMSGNHLDRNTMKEILRLDSKDEFVKTFEMGPYTDVIGKKGTSMAGRVTGRNKIVYAVTSKGKKIPIMTKVLRSKNSKTGKLETVYKYHPDFIKMVKQSNKQNGSLDR